MFGFECLTHSGSEKNYMISMGHYFFRTVMGLHGIRSTFWSSFTFFPQPLKIY